MFFSPTVPAKQIVLQKHSVDEKYKNKHLEYYPLVN